MQLWTRLARLSGRVALAILILWGVLTIPLPLPIPQLLVSVRVPIAVFIFIIYIGKALYDTFFYERHP